MPGRKKPSSKRYAQALFELAQQSGAVAEWDAQLLALAAAGGTPEFVTLMEAPEIADDERARALRHVLPDLTDGARNLLNLLARARAVEALPQVHERYRELVDAAEGVVQVQVASAVELTDDDTKRIAEQLSAALGGNVRITANVDPELLGGLVIRVGDRVIDGSARQRLSSLRGALARGMV